MKEIIRRSSANENTQELYSVVAQMVVTVSQDHAQLRALIYEFARTRLRKDLYSQFEQLGWSGIAAQVLALEAAIDQVEADCVAGALPPPLVSEALLSRGTLSPGTLSPGTLSPSTTEHSPDVSVDSSDTAAEQEENLSEASRGLSVPPEFLMPTRSQNPLSPLMRGPAHDERPVTVIYNRKSPSAAWWSIQLAAALAFGLVIYAASNVQFALGLFGLQRLDRTTKTDNGSVGRQDTNSRDGKLSAPGPMAPSRPGTPSFPVPSSYGVFALTNGQLTELDALPIKVPDPRVGISAVISTPSRAHLPIGQLQFVVFRRDLASNAPDHVAMRVVAQVVRALTFDSSGKPMVTNVTDSWVVRSNSYQMNVAPVADNPEMISIRPEHAEFLFPAGRYALALKGFAYDFTLDGPITDAAHCLERTDALNVPIYSECRNP